MLLAAKQIKAKWKDLFLKNPDKTPQKKKPPCFVWNYVSRRIYKF